MAPSPTAARSTTSAARSTFAGNSSTGPSGSGGAIYTNGSLTVSNSTFSGNSATGVCPPMSGCGCGAAVSGAIYNSGTLTVTNSTFSANRNATAGGGGAILNNGRLTVTNSTFVGNGGSGGAITTSSYGDIPLPATLTNTIVANSFSTANCAGAIIDGGHNLDDGTSCGFNMANGSLSTTNPQLDPAGLRNNGGPTQTIALLAGSPAIDAGDETICVAPPVSNLDQRGFVRPGAGATRCSIGAYEFDLSGPPAPTATTTRTASPTPTGTRTPVPPATATGTLTPSATAPLSTPVPCAGDCNNDQAVAIDELLTLVNIALDIAQPSACPDGVRNGAAVDVALIIQAVNSALNGCGG